MYSETTESIRVTVKPIFLEKQSSPIDNHYVWAYSVQIENMGEDQVQLLTRYWRITDAMGRMQEVHGAGVVGEQPILNPGESYDVGAPFLFLSFAPDQAPRESVKAPFLGASCVILAKGANRS